METDGQEGSTFAVSVCGHEDCMITAAYSHRRRFTASVRAELKALGRALFHGTAAASAPLWSLESEDFHR